MWQIIHTELYAMWVPGKLPPGRLPPTLTQTLTQGEEGGGNFLV